MHLIFLFKILPTPNDVCLINSNAFQLAIKSIFLSQTIFYQNQDLGPNTTFRNTRIIL